MGGEGGGEGRGSGKELGEGETELSGDFKLTKLKYCGQCSAKQFARVLSFITDHLCIQALRHYTFKTPEIKLYQVFY